MQNTVKPRVAVTSTHLSCVAHRTKFVGSGSLYKSMGLSRKKNKVVSKMKYKHRFLFGMKKL